MTSWENASASELAAAARAIEQEYRRREAMDEAARADRFREELQEVRDDSRALGDEHIAYLTPREVETAVNRGQVPGIAPDKRISRYR